MRFCHSRTPWGQKLRLFRRRYGIAPHVRYAVVLRKNTHSLVKGMILFDQGGEGAPLFLIYRHRQTNRQSVVRLFFLIFFALRILSRGPPFFFFIATGRRTISPWSTCFSLFFSLFEFWVSRQNKKKQKKWWEIHPLDPLALPCVPLECCCGGRRWWREMGRWVGG